jgi:hypothetical protein
MSHTRPTRWVFVLLAMVISLMPVRSSMAAQTNVTNLVSITRSGLVLNRSTNTFDQTVVVKNTSTNILDGPMAVAVTGLPAAVSLANATGTTADGSRYVVLPSTAGGLLPGQTLQPIVLKFSNPTRIMFSSTVQVLVLGALPPDPGDAGTLTIQGIDSDGDGVRDDIQRYIALTYPTSAKTRAALTQFAKGMQATLLTAGSKANALAATEQEGNAQYCLWHLYGLDGNPLWQKLRAQYLNTRDRSRAYGDYNHLLNAEVEKLPPDDQYKARCDFNPDALPN